MQESPVPLPWRWFRVPLSCIPLFYTEEKLNNIITLAMAGMKETTLTLIMARDSGAYKKRKEYLVSDLEMKTILDAGQADVAAHYGKIIIAEHVMKQHSLNPKAFRKAFKGMTIQDVYNDLCIELADQITKEEMGKYGGKQDNFGNIKDKDNGQHSSDQVAEGDKEGQQEARPLSLLDTFRRSVLVSWFRGARRDHRGVRGV